MSSLQKFHRRTLVAGGGPKLIGSGSDTIGYYLGNAYDNSYLYVAPLSTEVSKQYGGYNANRGFSNTTNGLPNTDSMYSYGAAMYPAAGYCKTLATGGYTTWYLPADIELLSVFSNRLAVPFSTNNAFTSNIFWTSTELDAKLALGRMGGSSYPGSYAPKKNTTQLVRAVRRSTV